MEKVLVTGADGFIGGKIITKLLSEDVEIYAVVYPGNRVDVDISSDKLHIIEHDLLASDTLESVPSEIDVMYHFAWVGVRPEQRKNLEIQIKNITLTMNVMKIASKTGVRRIVMPGSTNEYLYSNSIINKDTKPSPNDAYGTVKVALRYLCREYTKLNNIEFIYAIITGIYSEDRKDSNVIYYVISSLLKNEIPKLSKLEQKWDYVHIDDAINALIACGRYGKDDAVYAIGHGDNCKLNEYIYMIRDIINPEMQLGIGEIPYEREQLPSSCVDLTDIIKDTGFVPKIEFSDGIKRVIKQVRLDIENE